MLMDLFCEWFVGSFNNRQQTYDDPRSARYVMARHERTAENELYCSYYYNRSKFPYREMQFKMNYLDGDIHLTDLSGKKLIFVKDGSSFISNTEYRHNDKLYVFEAVLGKNRYRVNDRCYSEGELVRGLDSESWFEFKKVV